MLIVYRPAWQYFSHLVASALPVKGGIL
jgi:hypothetical protein